MCNLVPLALGERWCLWCRQRYRRRGVSIQTFVNVLDLDIDMVAVIVVGVVRL
jgi:uncharacterized Fe-S cluster-containing protein